ncbi:MAG: hypothetical protein I4O49_15955, partial [Janthinobacterium lividum]|nr:hypothetical protein [Janthinobacterium lividum]
ESSTGADATTGASPGSGPGNTAAAIAIAIAIATATATAQVAALAGRRGCAGARHYLHAWQAGRQQ